MAESVKNDHAIIIEINDERRRLDRTSVPPTMTYDHCSHSAAIATELPGDSVTVALTTPLRATGSPGVAVAYFNVCEPSKFVSGAVQLTGSGSGE
jgi:hypothetical protein